MSHKVEKELFVTGHHGTSKAEVFALVMAASCSIVMCEYMLSRFPARWSRGAPGLLFEFCAISVLHVLICTSALPLWPTFWALAAAATMCVGQRALEAVNAALEKEIPTGISPAKLNALLGPRKTYVSLFRGTLIAYTCIAILAVDFPAFPRRYAKAETYGTGLMDFGVGGVMLAAGLAAAGADAARGSSSSRPGVSNGGSGGSTLARRAYLGLRHAGACWVLGLARLLGTRAVDYQAHVGEYGVHWNFFHTIALVALAAAVVSPAPGRRLHLALGLMAAHQMVLSLGGLGAWALSSHRATDLLSLNKEGLVSVVGYWALHVWGGALAHAAHVALDTCLRRWRVGSRPQPQWHQGPDGSGAALGNALAVKAVEARTRASAAKGAAAGKGGAAGLGGQEERREQQQQQQQQQLLLRGLAVWVAALAAADGALWLGTVLLEEHVEPVSRRSCNAAYVLWIAAQSAATMVPLAAWQAADVAAAAATAEGEVVAACSGSSGAAAAPAAEGGGAGGGAADAGERQVPVASSAGGAGINGSGGCGRRAESFAVAGESNTAHVPAASHMRILQAINRNPLPTFLLANLLTGAVNLSTDTLRVPDWQARAILCAYMGTVCGAAVALHAWGVRLKL